MYNNEKERLKQYGGEKRKMEYKNDILYLRKSKAGDHAYMFNRKAQNGEDILGKGVNSLLINVAELKQLLGGNAEWIKVSAMREDSSKQTDLEGDAL